MSAIIKALVTSLEAEPENWETRLALIEAYLGDGDQDKAIEVLSTAESLPADDKGLVQAARSYALVGATDQAQEIFHYALQANPDNADAKAYLAALAAHSEGGAEESESETEAEEEETPVAEVAEEAPAEEPETPKVTPVTPKALRNPEEESEAKEEEKEESTAPPAPKAAAVAPPPTAVPTAKLLQAGATTEPKAAPAPVVVRQVDADAFDSEAAAELERIHEAEEQSRRQHESRIKRDKFNSIALTVVIHVLIILALTMVATKLPPNVPPQIVASSQSAETSDQIENKTMKRPTKTATSSSSSMADIVSVNATSNFAMSDMKFEATSTMGYAGTGMEFAPSMDLGMPSSSESKMMFGQKMEGDVLGVILDVSGSMAEYLPHVIREVDKNFKDAPVVFIRDAVVRKRTKEPDVRLVIPDEVKPRWDDDTRSPYWFLWYDLPKKAPQRYVDRLIEIFKTRPNQFLAIRNQGGDLITSAIDFLVEQDIDSLYIFSDFEDFVDEELAAEIGQNLGRRQIRTYIQPAEKTTENLHIMTNKVANRTRGRQMPSLVSMLDSITKDEPKSLTLAKPGDPLEDSPYNHATPRDEMIGNEWYSFKPSQNMTEITRLEEKEYIAVFYGPEAHAEIFLKDDNGKFIQNPIMFWYHSWYRDPELVKDPAYHGRRRKFLRLEEPPSFEDDEIIWKMVLEGELKFQVHMYLGGLGTRKMNATYTAQPPNDGTTDWAHISFRVPPLAFERNDVYFGQDLPAEGLKTLDEVRAGAQHSQVIFNLPRQDRDKYKDSWALDGFEPGYNTRTFDQLIRVMPRGIRDVKVDGASFGPRKIHARTTSSKILLTGWAGRRDIEPWEGFHAALVRPGDTREKFTKTEAISLEIE